MFAISSKSRVARTIVKPYHVMAGSIRVAWTGSTFVNFYHLYFVSFRTSKGKKKKKKKDSERRKDRIKKNKTRK